MGAPRFTTQELAEGVAQYLRQAADRTAGLTVSDPPTREELTALDVARDECRQGVKLADRAFKQATKDAERRA